jgi:hypothetical protein
MSDWETFCDESYYHLWRVRRKSERNFDDGYHLQQGEEARALVELLNRLEQERDEAREKYDMEATEHMLAVNKLCNDRDKALKELELIKEQYGR